jgi:hypothetical protein
MLAGPSKASGPAHRVADTGNDNEANRCKARGEACFLLALLAPVTETWLPGAGVGILLNDIFELYHGAPIQTGIYKISCTCFCGQYIKLSYHN